MLDFLLVIPTLNEEKYIGDMLLASGSILSRECKNYKIVIMDANSDDNTMEILRNAASHDPHIVIKGGLARGKRGRDVLHGMEMFESRAYCYIDADLSPSIAYIEEAIRKYSAGCDLAIGSRYINSKLLKRPFARKEVSLFYNHLIEFIFGDGVLDHQCGFKLFSRRFMLKVRGTRETHWAWDTEVILLAKYSGMRICEFPIKWTERRDRKTNFKKLARDILIFMPAICRLFWRFRIAKDF